MRTWVEKLTREYATEKKVLESYRDKLDLKKAADESDFSAVDGMVSDMNYALEWMRTGRRPGSRRGVENRNAYGRVALLDRQMFPSLDIEETEFEITDTDRRKLVDILWKMTPRERQCYLLHVCYGLSHAEVGTELKISRNTARTFIDRAKKKIIL